MQRIIISVSVVLLSLTLVGGCSYFPGVHKIDIQQGNLVTQDRVDKLKPGMTRTQVRFLMGSPMVIDTFSQDRWDYVYSLKSGKDENIIQKRLTLFFQDEKLSHFSGDYRPGTEAESAAAAGTSTEAPAQ